LLCCFERLTGVLEFLNVGSSGALLGPFGCLSGQLHRRFRLAYVGLTGALNFNFVIPLDNCTGVGV